MFEIENLSYQYNDADKIAALDNISTKIEEKIFTGIVGSVGSGKTTLALLLAGLITATKGKIKYKGKELGKEIHQHDLWEKIGIIQQQPEDQIFESTVYEEISYALKNKGVSQKEIEKKVHNSLKQVGLDKRFLQRSPFKLSGGEKRQVAIASIISYEPEIIIMDEPTVGLDKKAKQAINSFLQKVRGKKTVILITHDSEEISQMDELIVLSKGRLIEQGSPEKIIKNVFPQVSLIRPQRWQFADLLSNCGIRVDKNAEISSLIRTLKDKYELS